MKQFKLKKFSKQAIGTEKSQVPKKLPKLLLQLHYLLQVLRDNKGTKQKKVKLMS